MSQPSITAYTITFADAEECLSVVQNLRLQSIAHEMEVIVVAASLDGLSEDEFNGFHSHQWLLMPELRTVGAAMASATRHASAPYVVYAEEHATFDPAWAAALMAAHQRGYPAVGFTMRNANPETLISWAHLYGQFGPSVDPVESAEVRLLTGHHASYEKQTLLAYGDLLAAMLEDESALFLDLGLHGHKLLMAGDAISDHINLSRYSTYLSLDFHGQRSFASARSAAGRWNVWKRLVYAGACALVPLVRLQRILYHLRRTGRFGQLMPRILLPILPALAVGAVGEALGYIIGGGDAAESKLEPELRRRHFLSDDDPSRA